VLTRTIVVDPRDPAAETIRAAADILRAGGLVAFPTETVYGLGALALETSAVARLFDAKGRPATDPAIVHLSDADQLSVVADEIPPIAVALAARFWPGPLTLILRKSSRVPDAVTAGLGTVGVRVPAHPVALALLAAVGTPIAAPSANRFSKPSPTRAAHVVADLDGRIDLVLDAGPTDIGVESTVVDLTSDQPTVRRPGGLPIESLRELIPGVGVMYQSGDVSQRQLAPGQLAKHYAPRAKLTLYVGDMWSIAERLGRDVRARAAAGVRVGILAPEEDLMAMAPTIAAVAAGGRVRTAAYGARGDTSRAAHELFDALRRLDEEGVDEILASAPVPDGLGLAIHDRLTRAAEGRVIRI
jgi:L-threonylcarbamoyladenylate synthase